MKNPIKALDKLTAAILIFAMAFSQTPAFATTGQSLDDQIINNTATTSAFNESSDNSPSAAVNGFEAGPLSVAETVEAEQKLPDAVAFFLIELKKLLGEGFEVNVSPIQKDGAYNVTIRDSGNLERPSVALKEVTISVTKDGHVDISKPFTAHYYGQNGTTISVDGQLLFEGLKKLTSPLNSEIRDPTDQEVFKAMSETTVIKANASTVHFSKDGKNYKTYRDENGAVKVIEVVPQAVAAFAQSLRKLLGIGFKVIVSPIQKDGAYNVTIRDSGNLERPSVALKEVTISVTKDGHVDISKPFTAHYYGQNGTTISVDGQLLFEGLKKLMSPLNSEIRDPTDQEVFKAMSETTVIKTRAENGAIYFTKDGANYKTYRNASGQVIVEQEKVVILN